MDLAAAVVEEGAVSAEDLARALERQRDEGGTLDTALLELGLLDEERLASALARSSDLPAAPPDAYEAADPRARRVFPAKVAERHGLAPVSLDGRELRLVATCPVDLALLDEIGFMLSLHLSPQVGPEFRVRGLIHRLYGGELSPRLAALADAYSGGWPGEGAASGPVAGAAAEAEGTAPEEGGGAEEATPGAPPRAMGFEPDAADAEPLAAALAQAVEAAEAPLLAEESRAAVRGAAAGPDRAAPPRWTLKAARAALAGARGRDEVVLVALRYARDFFEHAAVFAVTRDAVVGHDALGADEDARDRARGTALYASDVGTFRTVIETRSPYLGPVSREAPGNEAVLDGLRRGVPRTVLVYPVLLRDRPVCIVYADNGEAPVSPGRLGDLLLLLSALGPAFERILLERKGRPDAAGAPSAIAPRAPAAAAAPAPAPPAAPPPGSTPPAAKAPREAPAAPPAPSAAASPPGSTPPATEAPGEVPAPAEARPAPPSAMEDVDVDVDLSEESPAAATDPDALAEALVASAPGSPGRAAVLAALAALGADAARALCVRLPGPVEVAPEALAATPADAQGPLFTALVALGPAATRPVTAVLTDADPARRRAAAAILGRVGDAACYPALADRAFDADPVVAKAACDALAAHRRDPKMRAIPEKLRRALLSGVSERPAHAAAALGALRDVESIPALIQVLEGSDGAAAEAAAAALARITLQRLGTAPRRWLAWWKENRGRGRAEWLFSGLASEDREVRVAAAEELGEAGAAPVAYSPDLPAGEREKAARAWASWWARSGRVL
jgi:hypothetical protein